MKNGNATTMCHLFSRRRHSHPHRVENTSFYKPTWFCGTELNIGLETQKMFILKAKQSFLVILVFYLDYSAVLVQHRK